MDSVLPRLILKTKHLQDTEKVAVHNVLDVLGTVSCQCTASSATPWSLPEVSAS